MPSDKDILTAFRDNPEQGGKLLFKRYYKPLVMLSSSFLPDNHFAEDVVQDVFYKFIKDRAYLRVLPGTLTTYLTKCVRNDCLNRLRDEKPLSRADLLQFDVAEEESTEYSPELIDKVWQAIDALPAKTRMVVVSIIMLGKKYKEAAEELGVSVNTVKTLLHNGITALRRQFPDSLLLMLFARPIFRKNVETHP